MNFTENAKSKFWANLSCGMKSAFGHGIGEAFHIDQYRKGHITFTEAVSGGPGTITQKMEVLKACSPAIESVRMTPLSGGYNATYSVAVDFDPVKAESVYSDGKTAFASITTGGKNYIVHDDGSATEVDDADKYVAKLNKTTGSNFKKSEDAGPETDTDGIPLDLDDVVALANVALEGTGVSVEHTDGRIVMSGDSKLVKPAQAYLPTPYYGTDELAGGYDDESGNLEVSVPEFATALDCATLRQFVIDAVNSVFDSINAQDATRCSDDEWCKAMAEAEPDDSYATQYGYKGESFVGGDKRKVATLVKTLMQENIDEARKVATKYMGAEMAEGFMHRYAPEKKTETHVTAFTDEMEVLDRIHESAMTRAPEKMVELDALVARNMFNKEKC